MSTFAKTFTTATVAAAGVFSGVQAAATHEANTASGRLSVGTSTYVRPQLPNGIEFEAGLTPEQENLIAANVYTAAAKVQNTGNVEIVAASGSCFERDLCLIGSCWVPIVGIACLGCLAIPC